MLLVVLIVSVFVCSASSSIALSECAQRPEDWCRDLESAKECGSATTGAHQRCVPDVWGKARRSQVMCTFCEFVLLKIDEQLHEDKTEADIKHAVDNVCPTLPQNMTGQCKSFVELYGDAIIVVIAYEIEPSVVCTALGICD